MWAVIMTAKPVDAHQSQGDRPYPRLEPLTVFPWKLDSSVQCGTGWSCTQNDRRANITTGELAPCTDCNTMASCCPTANENLRSARVPEQSDLHIDPLFVSREAYHG